MAAPMPEPPPVTSAPRAISRRSGTARRATRGTTCRRWCRRALSCATSREIEALVELAAAAQLRSEEVPREPEQLDAALGVGARGLEVELDLLGERAVDVGLGGCRHEATAADQLQVLVGARHPLRDLAAQRD